MNVLRNIMERFGLDGIGCAIVAGIGCVSVLTIWVFAYNVEKASNIRPLGITRNMRMDELRTMQGWEQDVAGRDPRTVYIMLAHEYVVATNDGSVYWTSPFFTNPELVPLLEAARIDK